ncbi:MULTISPECIES: winged helix-turn-helix domain-containing protein [unclassified Ruegeria]|uniref:winged helix-turn-helix domain-containing protein n=1 Tax=unclassified Ruegeria TaxID=2625375 RepID=UPI0012688E52|nr:MULTISPECIES: winged helix-turn-helix domain-containing protein [unclassified Ruegeria]QFT75592.1 Sensory transduction protein regX3 [Ruegeria sp. THAF33]UAB91161.1 winged helix-turn-helix transcriptional regulator [Ruegeria sp. SCSIO 43209]
MFRIAVGIGAFGAICAVVFVRLNDPWVIAEQKAESDAKMIAELIDTPDKISWHLTEDIPLLRALVWNADGQRQYPPIAGMVPVPYTFSDEAETELAYFQVQTQTPIWAPFDVESSQLLYCRTAPPVCLIYERASLEEYLELTSGALASKGSNQLALLLLTAIASLLGFVYIWFRQTERTRSSGFKLDPKRYVVQRDSLQVSLTPRDVKLLSLLQERVGTVVTKDELFDRGWAREYTPNSRALDQHIINLRKKLDPDKSRPVLIETVHGVGYRFVV